ncbi:MAG: Na+/H+ antiporter NhaC [Gammaproteobacteria bacterium]|nr:Na+/H+ antiporter NhaC [Gammaproteobacteria bacterium]
MTTLNSVEHPAPGAGHAALCFGVVIAIIAIGLFFFSVSLHSLMFLSLLWVAFNASWLGYRFGDIRELMSGAISRALPAIYIFILIGMVIASFLHAGTIATLMYFGLDLLTPTLFLSLGMLLCALMSIATGTSWGTVGTLGVVFIGLGETMAIPLPLVAGMIVCGATFGDKMSPVSDTTNLAAMSAGTNLYRHIYSMLFTTVPSFLLVLILFTAIGFSYRHSELTIAEIGAIREALAGIYHLSPLITLLPLVVLATLSMRRIAAEASMSLSVVVAVLIAVFYQGSEPQMVLNALWANTPTQTGLESLDELLGRGGIYSMSWTLLLAILALALGGILHGAGFLRSLLVGLIARVQRVGTLIACTIVSGLVGNMALGEAYITIILNCQLFGEKYDANQLDRAVLSRSVEEGSTLTTSLIPWTTAGAFYTATLGVPVLDYAPYAFFNYFNAVVSILMASFGIGLLKQVPTKTVLNLAK